MNAFNSTPRVLLDCREWIPCMRLAIRGAVSLAVGALAVLADGTAMVDRVAPILLFVLFITVVTEPATEVSIFR